MDACTIIAKNYVAQARVLARSFLEHHPGGRFWTLIIDDFDGLIEPENEPFKTLTPADVGCEPFLDMAFRYTILELSTAVKPWLMRHLMAEVDGPITYLDPDIEVFGSLERLEQLAREHKVVLTPHNTTPIPDDGRRPTQVDIMIAGIYNLGYLSLGRSPEIEELLDWWQDRLRRDCRVDPVYGYFVDQRWFDLTPGLVAQPAIVRETEFNVAYWNLHSRKLEREGRGYTVDGKPLAFFHYSGFDPAEPAVLSRHQTRVSVEGNPALERILGDYAARVAAEGYDRARTFPYTYDTLPDGTRLDPVVRAMFAEAEADGDLKLSPFTQEGAEAFLAWLSVPSPNAPPGVNRLLGRLYGTRSDLREAFPDIGGEDLDGLFTWAHTHGAREVPVLGRLDIPTSRRDSAAGVAGAAGGEAAGAAVAPVAPAKPRPFGVNVAGHFQSELGVGEAARQVISALDAAHVPLVAVAGGPRPLSRQGHTFEIADRSTAAFPFNVICVNADMVPEFAGWAGEEFFAGRYSIGLWFWEVSAFRTEWQGSFRLVDEVWAPSAHIADALAPVSPIPIVPMRIPVEMPGLVPRSRADLGMPDGQLFLFSFDYLSVFARKNPLGAIEAFARAFPGADAEGRHLVLKCINSERDPAGHAQLVAAAAEHPNVTIIDHYLDPADKDALMANCDCFVSLHRSEGFGLTMAEAMYLGKPVIATGYSGNLDFMTDDNSLLVDYELVPIGSGAAPYPADGVWAEPDLDHAAALMRIVAEDPSAAAALGARAAQQIRETHSPAVAGTMMRQRLEHLAPALDVVGGELPPTARGSQIARAGARVGSGPWASRPGSRLKRAARRGALGLTRPLAGYQQTVNGDLVRALESVDEALDRLGDQQLLEIARLDQRLRALDRQQGLVRIVSARGRILDELKDSVTSLGGRVDELQRAVPLESARAVYTALAELVGRYEQAGGEPGGAARRGPLTPHELRVFSQNGEDGVIAEILARIGTGERWFVEFGVESGREGNCVALADIFGWQGLFMDCDEVFYPQLADKYSASESVRTIEAMVTPENVQELFAAGGVPAEPDVVAIDIDGGDYWVWEALQDYRPRLVVIEYNSLLDPERRLVQPRDLGPWDGTDYFGASLGAMVSMGERHGYRLVHTELCGVNAFFVRDDLAEGRFGDASGTAGRGAPNYFMRGIRHPAHRGPRLYLDLDSDELVDIDAEAEGAPEGAGAR